MSRLLFNFLDGAGNETRTRKGHPTRPSNVRVYQFHHPGTTERLYAGKALPATFILHLPQFCLLKYAALFDTRCLTTQLTQVVKLGTTDFSETYHFNFVD